MSQLPEFEPGTSVFCVLRSATVRWLHFALPSVIGVASSGPSTGSPAAELVSGEKSVNLVLTARTGRAITTTNVSASFRRLDIDTLQEERVEMRTHRAMRP